VRLRLPDFDEDQLATLARHYGAPISDHEIGAFRALLGEHQYLSRVGQKKMAIHGNTVDDPTVIAAAESNPFADYLRHYLFKLKEHGALVEGLKCVINIQALTDVSTFDRLLALGLINSDMRASARIRCEVYRRCFWPRL
jgi:AAA-like domain